MPAIKSKKKKPTKRNFKPLIYRIIALTCVLIAFGLLIGFFGFINFPAKQNNNPIQINSNLYLNKASENIPVKIIIPEVNIDLPVVQAKVVDGYWEISEHTASYGDGSGIPGQNGNTVIFAHARVGLFYNLKDVKTGDIVYVFTKNSLYRYKVNKIMAVYPNQTEVIKPTKDQTLTLYTCTGFSDEKRLVVTATPELLAPTINLEPTF